MEILKINNMNWVTVPTFFWNQQWNETYMNLWRQCFVFTCAIQSVDARHRQLSLALPLRRALSHCRRSRAVSWCQVAGEVKDISSVDGPLALQDCLTDVVHPVDHDSILRAEKQRDWIEQLTVRVHYSLALSPFWTHLRPKGEAISTLL